jgi:hypothetical protein
MGLSFVAKNRGASIHCTGLDSNHRIYSCRDVDGKGGDQNGLMLSNIFAI